MSDQSTSAPVSHLTPMPGPSAQHNISPQRLMQTMELMQTQPHLLMQIQQQMMMEPQLLMQTLQQLQMQPELVVLIHQQLQMQPQLLMQMQQHQQLQPQLLMPMPLLHPPPIYQMPKQPELWHPDHADSIQGQPSKECLRRFLSDIRRLVENPQPGAHIFMDESDVTLAELLLIGSSGTPYKDGFFHFRVRAMPDYPKSPPRVAFRTASPNGLVRFHPNFYENGCVCLSILGTWPGDGIWQETYRLENLVHALQFRMDDKPLYHEPVLLFDQQLPEKSQHYNDQIAYETLRMSVCHQLESRSLPPELHRRAAAHFATNYQAYRSRCVELRKRLDGVPIVNVYNGLKERFEDTFEFAAVYRRMEKLLPIAQRDAEASDEP